MLTTNVVNVCVVFLVLNSVIKRVKQCCCTLILLPKSTLNANLTTTNRFFTNDDWQRGQFENFESDHQYESNLESDVRFKIESNHEASQVTSLLSLWACSNSISDTYEHSEESDISSLSRIVVARVQKQLVLSLRARCKCSGTRLQAFASLCGHYFVYMQQNGGCRTMFYFDDSGAVYICVARYNEYVNF